MSDYSKVLVHIDNGHAKSTPGKRSPYAGFKTEPALDFYEYESNREIAAILKKKLDAEGFCVNMVVPEIEDDISLTTRYKRANASKSNNPDKKSIFISIHSDAAGDGKTWNNARGWSAYTTKGHTNSDVLAECLYDAAERILPRFGTKIRTDKSDGDRDYEENFTVIYGANMPAVLTENLFFTNIEDTKILLSDEGKDAIAQIHLEGIKDFCKKANYV